MKRIVYAVAAVLAASSLGLSGQQAVIDGGTRAVAVTLDDLPATAMAGGTCDGSELVDLTSRLLAHLQTHQVPATGFVTENGICDRLRDVWLPKLLSMWLDAGVELGNHAFSHLDINDVPLEKYKKDILLGEKTTRRLMDERGLTLRYFRHPFLHAGADADTKRELNSFLAERSYAVAPVTIDSQEWVFAAVYRRAKERNDSETMERLANAYIPFMEHVFQFFESWSVKVIGYEPPQVLLLHANEFNADHLGALVEMLRKRGYRFVSLDEALKDKAYRSPDGYIGSRGLSWIHRWAVAKGLELEEEPREPEWLGELLRSY
jgi:peptidoglycan/xylan/chitin deacetylase (PgdA/CDA1 family)